MAAETLSGDRLAEAYRDNARPLLVYFIRRTYDAQAASDLVADTFAAALAARTSFRGGDSSGELAAWLYGIARHRLAAYFKRGRIERRALRRLPVDRAELGEEEIDRIEELAGLSALRSRVADGLDGLSPDYRDALRLRVVDELPYADVAARLAISEDTARARVSRGLRRLADALEQPTAVEVSGE
jgi:RNA polymerase sigma factor (sigma-70 family)